VNHDTFTLELDTPTDGTELSGDVQVSWTASTEVSVDVYVIQDGISVLVGSNIVANQTTFDSNEFTNGPAIILIEASNGVYSVSASVSVQFNNQFPSTLPDITTTTNRNLPAWLFVHILAGWAIVVVVRRKITKGNID
jgi:hypothetical protein